MKNIWLVVDNTGKKLAYSPIRLAPKLRIASNPETNQEYDDAKDGEVGEFERCVSCWNPTDIKKNTPIDKRPFYVEGVGQLDRECFMEVYGIRK